MTRFEAAEIAALSDEGCDEYTESDGLCLSHMISRLDQHKRFQRTGKELLKAMKAYGDKSVLLDSGN